MLDRLLELVGSPWPARKRGTPRPVPESLERDLAIGAELANAGLVQLGECLQIILEGPAPEPAEVESRTLAARKESIRMWAELLFRADLERRRSIDRARYWDEHERLTGQSPMSEVIETQWGAVSVSASTGDPVAEVERARRSGTLPQDGYRGGSLEPVAHRWLLAAGEHLDDCALAIAWAIAEPEQSKLLDAVPARGPALEWPAAIEAARKAVREMRARALQRRKKEPR